MVPRMHTMRSLAAACCALTQPAIAQTVYTTIDGPRPRDTFADAIAIGDLTGDTVSEFVVVAAAGNDFGPSWFGTPAADLHWYDGASLLPLGPVVEGEVHSSYCLASCPAGDFDGDGITDILWHHLGLGPTGENEYAEVHSGRTQQRLARFDQPGVLEFGRVLAGIGDVNGDGYDDVLVGSYAQGTLFVYGGPDGHLIRAHYQLGGFYNSAAGLGDIDGDGVPDYAHGSATAGRIRIFSGATGAVLRVQVGPQHSGFGNAITSVGDIDGDGVPDYAVGAPTTVFFGMRESSVYVYSGASGAQLAQLQSAYNNFDDFGGVLSGGADVNGDCINDLVVGTGIPHYSPGSGYVEVFSLRTFQRILRFPGSLANGPSPPSVRLVGDLDGDGLSEWIVCWMSSNYSVPLSGRIWFLRGARGDADVYCTAQPNSLGRPARLSFEGPLTVQHPEQRLVVEDAVASSFAQLFYGVASNGVAFGDGLLCASGTLYRLGAPFPLGATGAGARPIDWSNGPHVAGAGAWLAGSAFGLQVVYRDVGVPGGAGFNTTNALRVVFNQ